MGEGRAAPAGACGVQGRTRSWNRTFPSCAAVIHGLSLEMKNLHSLKVHQ